VKYELDIVAITNVIVHNTAYFIGIYFNIADFTLPICSVKGKAFPLQAWTGLWGFSRLRLQNL
jgi:hypothetical protein